jgi:16S rRNA (cytosine1402-N4)-methyltransferase
VLIADLGLSSMQIDDPARGFSFKSDGPLDMRMNPARGQPASALLARLDMAGLARLLVDNADEPHAHDVSAAILSAHARRPLTTTRLLAEAVRASLGPSSHPRDRDDDTVRRVFQALRIAVNDEFATLEAFLRILPSCLKPGGRAAILTFHSGEDRRVKSAFKDGLHDGSYVSISKEVLRASAEERRANPRSTSAKLRFAIRSSKS